MTRLIFAYSGVKYEEQKVTFEEWKNLKSAQPFEALPVLEITENGKTYWMPEVLPEPTKEYQAIQKEKNYLTQEGVEKRHPEWTYAENIANVDDEYLFQNEGWKLIIDDKGPVILDTDLKHKTRNEIVDWEEQEGGKRHKKTMENTKLWGQAQNVKNKKQLELHFHHYL